MILTRELVGMAIDIVQPTIIEILKTNGLIWGPRWVAIRVKVPGFDKIICSEISVVSDKRWRSEWGEEKNFGEIAEKKCVVAGREGLNTSVIVATKPWLLKEGEYLYSGGAVRDGISVGISGALGIVDETIAMMIIDAIVMLTQVEAEKRIKEGKKQI